RAVPLPHGRRSVFQHQAWHLLLRCLRSLLFVTCLRPAYLNRRKRSEQRTLKFNFLYLHNSPDKTEIRSCTPRRSIEADALDSPTTKCLVSVKLPRFTRYTNRGGPP